MNMNETNTAVSLLLCVLHLHNKMTSSWFQRSILAYVWTSRRRAFDTTNKSLFDKKKSNQFYICLCIKIFNILFCLLFKLFSKYILFNTLQKVFTAHIEIYEDATANDGYPKQSNCRWRPFKTVKISNTQRFSSFENIVSIKHFS